MNDAVHTFADTKDARETMQGKEVNHVGPDVSGQVLDGAQCCRLRITFHDGEGMSSTPRCDDWWRSSCSMRQRQSQCKVGVGCTKEYRGVNYLLSNFSTSSLSLEVEFSSRLLELVCPYWCYSNKGHSQASHHFIVQTVSSLGEARPAPPPPPPAPPSSLLLIIILWSLTVLVPSIHHI